MFMQDIALVVQGTLDTLKHRISAQWLNLIYNLVVLVKLFQVVGARDENDEYGADHTASDDRCKKSQSYVRGKFVESTPQVDADGTSSGGGSAKCTGRQDKRIHAIHVHSANERKLKKANAAARVFC